MSNKQIEIIDNEQLQEISDRIELIIVTKYKRILVGVITGIVVSFSILTYFGFDYIQESLKEKVAKKIITSEFSNVVINKVTAEISKSIEATTSEINLNKELAQRLVDDIETSHTDILDAASNEFRRTIKVLKTLRIKVNNRNKVNDQ